MQLECDDDCASLMVELGDRLGMSRVVGVSSAESSPAIDDEPRFRVIDVDTESGEARESFVAADGAPIALAESAAAIPRAKFRPLYLVPFGAGQFVQYRAVAGAVYATAETALLAWFVVGWRRHADAVADQNVGTARGPSGATRPRWGALPLVFGRGSRGVFDRGLAHWRGQLTRAHTLQSHAS